MITLATAFMIIGAALLVLALPLAFGAVPMNRAYGFRTAEAFKSPADWRRVNARGGRFLACEALILVVAGIAGFLVPDIGSPAYIGLSLILLVLSSAIGLGHSLSPKS
ncbi:MAG: SdpI family protein [Patescibacteria group bacterium]|nr:SdpI family protein [Patescibacteria group bacterium]